MEYEIKQEEKFRFIEEGEGEPLVLLHGLFGALSNFMDLIEYFRHHYKVVVPILPLTTVEVPWLVMPAPPLKPPKSAAVPRVTGGGTTTTPVVLA